MKKIIYGLIFLCFLAVPLPILAQVENPESTSSSGRGVKSSSPSATSTPTVNIEIFASVKTAVARLNAAVDRIEKIKEKITSRMEKLKSSGVKTTKLNQSYNYLIRDAKDLRTNTDKISSASSIFLKSSSMKKDYPLFKKQLTSVLTELNEVLSAEKSLVSDMKLLASPTATPTIKISPTKVQTK